MLVALYIISAIAGVFASIFDYKGKFKSQLISIIVAILSGVAFCIPMIREIVKDISEPDFWSIFAVLSLLAWHFTFLLNDWENLLNYEISFFILSMLISFFCSSYYYDDYLTSCNTDHITTEIIPIINVVEDKEHSIYRYYFKDENGVTQPAEIPMLSVTINYIGDDISPYLEIITVTDCMGYTIETHRHAFTTVQKSYNLYITEGTI